MWDSDHSDDDKSNDSSSSDGFSFRLNFDKPVNNGAGDTSNSNNNKKPKKDRKKKISGRSGDNTSDKSANKTTVFETSLKSSRDSGVWEYVFDLPAKEMDILATVKKQVELMKFKDTPLEDKKKTADGKSEDKENRNIVANFK